MPNRPQTDDIRDLASLLRAGRKNKRALPGIAPYLEALKSAHDEVVSHRHRCTALRAASREATQHLQKSIAEGRDAASRARSYIRSVLGIRSEQLVQYGITPARKRDRRPRKDAGPGLPG